MAASTDVKVTIIGKDKASGAFKKVGSALGGLGKAAIAAGAIGGAAILGLGAGLAKLALDAAPIEGIKVAFEGLASSFEGGSDAMMSAMQTASAGMISNTDLMSTFNEAAQLVSTDFAQSMPEAMAYFGKVSAATGKDMDYLMSSLVTGVGRLSPMILDNLGITMDLTAAYEEWGAEMGVSVSEMSKADKQAAAYAQVLQKLEENVGGLPDVSELAASKMARLRATFQNAKDTIGMALLPALSALLDILASAASSILPVVIAWFETFGETLVAFIEFVRAVVTDGDYLNDWLTHLPTSIRGAVQAFGQLIAAVQGFIRGFKAEGLNIGLENFLDALDIKPPAGLWTALDAIRQGFRDIASAIGAFVSLSPGDFPWEDILPAWAAGIAYGISAGFESLVAAFRKIPGAAKWFINIVKKIATKYAPELKGSFSAIATMIGIFIAKAALIKTLLPILGILKALIGVVLGLASPITLLIAAVALLGAAWGGNWFGIRDKTQQVIDAIAPYFETLKAWLEVEIPRAVEEVKGVFEDLFSFFSSAEGVDGAGFLDTIKETLDNLAEEVGPALEEIKTFFIEEFGVIVDWVNENMPLIKEAFSDTLGTIREIVETVLTGISDFWTAHGDQIMEVVRFVWETIKTVIDTAIKVILGIIEVILSIIAGDWDNAWQTIQETAATVWEAIKSVISTALDLLVNTIIPMALEILKSVITAAWNFIKEQAPVVWEFIKTAIANVWNWLKEQAPVVWEAIKQAIADAWEKIKILAPIVWAAIKSVVTQVWAEMKERISAKLAEIWADVQTKWASIKADIAARLAEIWADVQTKWASIKADIAARLAEIWADVQTKWASIKEDIAARLAEILTDVETKWASIKADIETALAEILADVETKWESIKADITARLEEIWTEVQTKWGEIKTEIATKMQEIQTAISDKWEAIKRNIFSAISAIYRTVKTLWGEIKAAIRTKVQEIWQAISDKFTEIVTLVGAKLREVIDAVLGLGQAFSDAGASIVSSLKAGMQRKFDELIAWARSKLQQIRDMLGGSEPKDPTSPLRGLGAAGEAIIGNLQGGMESAAPGLIGGTRDILGGVADEFVNLGDQVGSEVTDLTDVVTEFTDGVVDEFDDMGGATDDMAETMGGVLRRLVDALESSLSAWEVFSTSAVDALYAVVDALRELRGELGNPMPTLDPIVIPPPIIPEIDLPPWMVEGPWPGFEPDRPPWIVDIPPPVIPDIGEPPLPPDIGEPPVPGVTVNIETVETSDPADFIAGLEFLAGV